MDARRTFRDTRITAEEFIHWIAEQGVRASIEIRHDSVDEATHVSVSIGNGHAKIIVTDRARAVANFDAIEYAAREAIKMSIAGEDIGRLRGKIGGTWEVW